MTQWEGDAAAYVHVGAIRLEGELNRGLLQQSLAHISQRHEILRTRFGRDQGRGQAYIEERVQVRLPVQDLRGLVGVEQAGQSEAAMAALRGSLDLSQGFLLQFTLLWLAAETHVLVFAAHQLIWDSHSDGIFLQELAMSYSQHRDQAALPVQYQELARRERQWLQEKSGQRALAYWEKQLRRLPSPLALASRGTRPAVQRLGSASQGFTVPAAVVRGLTAVSEEGQTAVDITLLAAFKALLWRYTGQTDIVVGMETAGRDRTGMIGPLGNTVVMRSDLRGNPSFGAALARVSQAARAAEAHAGMPFAVLVSALPGERDTSRPPLCQVAFSCEERREPARATAALRLQRLAVANQTSPFDLRLAMAVGEPQWTGVFTYNTDLFHGAAIERMVGHFQELLASIAANPEQRLSELSLLTARERQQLLVEWNATQRVYPQQQGLHEMFAAQAAHTPEAIAVVYEDSCLTYGQLERRANQLAHYLRQQGVGAETLVGVCLERTPEMVVALLGILKAGGGYVPLDPAYPAERQRYILEDSGARLLLTSAGVQPHLPATAVTVVRLEEVATAVAAQPGTPPPVQVSAAHIAYVIYTSGSTGRPKGVLITHGNALSLIHWAQETFAPALFQGILAATSLCFDLSVFELFVPLSSGGCLILAENALELPRLPAATAVRLVNTVPSAMRELLRLQGLPASVQAVNLAGEPLAVTLVDQLYQAGLENVYDLYGPSEDTTYSTYTRREAGAAATIGRPIANSEVYLLDRHLQPVPVGVPGELYLGGAGLARGYHQRPDLTAAKFIPHPFSQEGGARLYQTGDLARYRADGNLEFLGRIDHQVKVRGYRIELGEIEAVLSGHEAVAETVVQVREDAGAAPQLVAYVVPVVGQAPGSSELRYFLQQTLPEYMVPAHWVMLDALPLLPNGKIDRRALPAPDHDRLAVESVYVAPRTPFEVQIADIWAQILGLARVGIHDNFFELGGHSLLATQVIVRLGEALSIALSLRTLFQMPTVAGLAAHIQTILPGRGRPQLPPIQPARQEFLPLSFAQQQLWLVDQLEPGNIAYNIPLCLRFTGRLNPLMLFQSLNEIVRRHTALRTIVTWHNGQPVQTILPGVQLPLWHIDLTALPPVVRQAESQRLLQAAARQPFALAQGPLIRALWLQQTGSDSQLLLTMHHIVTDGWSLRLLIQELAILYQSQASGQPVTLPSLPCQYADFAYWQRQQFQDEAFTSQLAFWQQQLAGAPPLLDLPTDRPRPAVQTFGGACQPFTLSLPLTQAVQALSRREGATLFMTLLAAFKALLYRYTGQADIVVGSPMANRERPEVQLLIGYFVNVMALRTSLADNPTFRQLLARVHLTAINAYAHADLPFEKIVRAIRPERNLSYNPLFQTVFTLQEILEAVQITSELTVKSVTIDPKTTLFDLRLEMTVTEQGLVGFIEYNTDLFDAATITGMLAHYQTLLESATSNPDQPLLVLLSSIHIERHQSPDQNTAQSKKYIDPSDKMRDAVAQRRSKLSVQRDKLSAAQQSLFEKRLRGE